jgi:glutaminyl-tRNA synthetase
VRLYDRLFASESPGDVPEGKTFLDNLSATSLEVLSNAKLEPSLSSEAPGVRVQLERIGYFCVDPASGGGKPVWNRVLTLKDTWAKLEKRGG